MRNKYPNPSDAVAAILKAGTDVDVSLARAFTENNNNNSARPKLRPQTRTLTFNPLTRGTNPTQTVRGLVRVAPPPQSCAPRCSLNCAP